LEGSLDRSGILLGFYGYGFLVGFFKGFPNRSLIPLILEGSFLRILLGILLMLGG